MELKFSIDNPPDFEKLYTFAPKFSAIFLQLKPIPLLAPNITTILLFKLFKLIFSSIK